VNGARRSRAISEDHARASRHHREAASKMWLPLPSRIALRRCDVRERAFTYIYMCLPALSVLWACVMRAVVYLYAASLVWRWFFASSRQVHCACFGKTYSRPSRLHDSRTKHRGGHCTNTLAQSSSPNVNKRTTGQTLKAGNTGQGGEWFSVVSLDAARIWSP